jgi:iron-sulfur cluster repair protein YtfE (RIC family)
MRFIDPSWTVHELLRLIPESGASLQRVGIDTCCGGSLTLAQAAASAGTSVEAIARDLSETVSPAPIADACSIHR